jgi:hypothetical protein
VQSFPQRNKSEGRPAGSPLQLREGYGIGPEGTFIYRPPRGSGAIIGGLISGVALLLSLLLFLRAIDEGATLIGLLSLLVGLFLFGLGCLFGFWTYGCITLQYQVGRDGLVIRWGIIRQIIPLREIRRLVVGAQIEVPRIRGVNWLGYHVGSATIDRIGDTLFYSTHQQKDELLYVLTAGPAYAITVLEPTVFAGAVQQQRSLGPTSPYPIRPAHPWPVFQSFLLDRRAVLVALGAIAAFAVAAAYVLIRYPGLPEEVLVSFPAATERLVPKRDVLDIPLAGGAILVVNLVLAYLLHSWERALSYLIMGASIGLSVLLLSGAVIALV